MFGVLRLTGLGAAMAVASLIGVSCAGTAIAETRREGPPPKAPASKASSVIDPAFAARQKAKLDRLFAELKTVPSPKAGQAIVKKIWAVWMSSGNVDVDALMKQARLALQEGGVEEAFGALDRVIEIAPDYAEGWNRRATLNFALGRHAQSVRDIQQTLALEPRHFGALSGFAQILARAGKWKGALKAFEAAVAVNPFLPSKDAVLRELRQKALGQPL